MKSFQKFSILFAVPLLFICIVAFITDQNQENFTNVRANFLLPTFLLIMSGVYVYIFKKRFKSESYLKRIAFSVLIIAASIFVVSYAFFYVYDSTTNAKIPLSQAWLFAVIFIFYVVILHIYKSVLKNVQLIFPEKPAVYFTLASGLMAGLVIIWILLSYEFFLNDSIAFGSSQTFFINIVFVIFATTITSFSSLFLLQKVDFVNGSIVVLIILATIASTAMNLTNPFVEVTSKGSLLFGYLLTSFFITSLISAIVLYRNQMLTNNEKIKILRSSFSRKEAEYLQLKNQVSPHFLFNNLNTLISLIETNPDQAIEFGHNLSNVYRHHLKSQPEDFVPLNDELAFIENYLEIYKTKFESGFVVSLQNENTSELYILSNSLQEVIDNIFKHNFPDDQNPIQILIQIENQSLVVINSIRMKETQISHKTGLENIQKRYQILTQKEVMISHDKQNFSVTLPLLNMEI